MPVNTFAELVQPTSHPFMLRHRNRLFMIGLAPRILLCLAFLCAPPTDAAAESVVELPVLASLPSNDRGVFAILLLHWDQKPEPNPVALQWLKAGVTLGQTHADAMALAFRYAVERTPSVPHTGTVSVQGVTYILSTSDGPSAGAAMAVGFIAMFKGDPIQRGVALTGTIHPDGSIGPVGSIPDKIRAAAREGYRTVLIPAGQLYDPHWNLTELGMELNVTIKEVHTIEEAYELMTGRKL